MKLFFQPNEEGTGGAERMIQAGCMEDPHVDVVFGGHVNPELPVGTVGIRYGSAYAASNPFHITLTGASTHGAQPDAGHDPIVCAAQIISAAQTLVSRRTAPTDAAVVTFGSIHAGTAGNIIPGTATLTGIIRTLGPEAAVAQQRNLRRWFPALPPLWGFPQRSRWRPAIPVLSTAMPPLT